MIITKSNCNSQWWWRQRQLCYCSCRIPHPYRSQFRCSAITICHWFDIIEFRLLATSRSSLLSYVGKWASERHIACYCSSYENIFVRAPRFPFSRGIERTTTKYFLFLRIRNEVQRAKFFAFSCWLFYVRFLTNLLIVRLVWHFIISSFHGSCGSPFTYDFVILAICDLPATISATDIDSSCACVSEWVCLCASE